MKQQPLWHFDFVPFFFTLAVLVLAVFLRFWRLSDLPTSPYWEEVALGYDAYSLLKTGMDHHGNSWPVLAFESFGDWKPSGYFYALLPSIALFGLSVFAVRLPSALAGVGIVILFPRFVSALLQRKLSKIETIWLHLIAAICPWLLVFSRGGWEVNLATLLLIGGSIFWLDALPQQIAKIKWIHAVAAILCFVAAIYTYHALRVIAPLWAIGIGVQWLVSLKQKKALYLKAASQLLLLAIIAAISLTPMIAQLQNKAVTQRFQETSIFSDPTSVRLSNEQRAEHGDELWARILYHRYRYQAAIIIDKIFQHASVNFLFVTGDSNARHRGSMYGQLLYPDAFLIGLGIIWLVVTKQKGKWLLVWFWLAAVLPASISTATPHALRTLPSAIIWLTMSAMGLHAAASWLKGVIPTFLRYGCIGVFMSLYIGFGWLWWHTYTTQYPVLFASDWQFGYSQMISATQHLAASNLDLPIVISRQQGRPAMYWWFYSQTDPNQVQALDAIVTKDQGEYLEFSTVQFTSILGNYKPGSIVALSESEWQSLRADHPTWDLASTSIIRRPDYSIVWLVGILRSK